ncbi:hypothetical protein [Nannocystis bainbridge]|uniref:DNA-binding beta-propeller fold protein YncE n=1 Tax=Nannocystis bainbridge TaxID=2995303 RepID=A0ABT5EB68_9BACT|nr:hypothetical protein [Nannocystis bainbridge]MDC0723112.1 hypothetical protein [Nannocystis bainbridge]
MTPLRFAWTLPLCLVVSLAGCAMDSGSYGGGDTEGGWDSGDSNGLGTDGTDGTGTGAGEPPPPETEDDGDFRVPKASGKYVYSASESTDSVAVIDTANLAIDVVEVGQGPTVVEPIPGQPGDAGSVVVLDQGSNDIAILRTGQTGGTTVEIHKVTPGANNLAVSPGGNYVFVYHDVDGPEQQGPGSDQELTVLDVAAGLTHRMTVGAHPRDVVFAPDETTAWIVTAAGVNVISFAALGEVGKPPLLPVVKDPGVDPARVEVQIVAAERLALARVDGEPWLAITQLPGGELTVLDLPGVPTDLDVAPTGDFAVLTLPEAGGSRFLEVPLPLGPGEFVAHDVPGEYVGLASVAGSGDTLLLYATVDPFPADSPQPDPRQRITLARRDGDAWDLVTLFVEVPLVSAGLAPDSRSAILVHDLDPAAQPAAWSYSLFDLTPAYPLLKRQTTLAPPGPILFTPEGDRAAVLLRDDATAVRKVDLVNLDNFIVKPLLLGSPPEGAGYVDSTQKVFVSQAHPTGRITFIGPDGDVQTVTGYVLNDSVKD